MAMIFHSTSIQSLSENKGQLFALFIAVPKFGWKGNMENYVTASFQEKCRVLPSCKLIIKDNFEWI